MKEVIETLQKLKFENPVSFQNIHNYADANEYTRKFHLESLMSDCEMHKCCICNKEVLQVEHAISRCVQKPQHFQLFLEFREKLNTIHF